MRIPVTFRMLLAVVLAMAGGIVITSAASADTGKVKFRGTADVVELSVLGTVSTFDYARKGDIKRVQIQTLGEIVVANNLQVDCRPRRSALCNALDGATIRDFHTSTETLRDVSVVPNPFSLAIGLGDVGALSGKLSGQLEGDLVITNGVDAIPGTLSMRIRGTATMSCVVFPSPSPLVPVFPVPISACEDKDGTPGPDGGGFLVPVVFEVDDHGTFELGPASGGAYSGILGGSGKARAVIAGSFAGQGGVLTITGGELIVADDGESDGDSDDDSDD